MVSEETKKLMISDYENGLSLGDICKKYNMTSKVYISKYVLNGKTRSLSESIKLAHKNHSEAYKHSDETKQKLRDIRLKWMRDNPEKTAWRLKNLSYPEKCFKRLLERNEIDKKYLIYREYSVFPFFIDFAFIDIKLAVEIDGSQHLKDDRKLKDDEKDALLLSKGWRIFRVTAYEVIHNQDKVLFSLLHLLGDNEVKYEKVGILRERKTYKKVHRGEDGKTDKERLRAYNQRKVERPNKEDLMRMIKEKTFTSIAKEFNVSDKAIVKWCKYYGLPYRKKDLKN